MAYEINEYLTSCISILNDNHGKDMWEFIQWLDKDSGQWFDCEEPTDLGLFDDYVYRIRPGTFG